MKNWLITYSTLEWPRFVTCLRGSEMTVKRFVQKVKAAGGEIQEIQIVR